MRILLIRPGAIGDSLLTFPVLQALRTHYKEVHIALVSNSAVLPLAQAYHLADEVFDYGSSFWSQLFLPPDKYSQEFRVLLQQTDEVICWLRDENGIVEHGLHTAGIQRVLVAPGRPAEGKRLHVVDYLLQTIGLQSVGAEVDDAAEWGPSGSPVAAEDTHPGDISPLDRQNIHNGIWYPQQRTTARVPVSVFRWTTRPSPLIISHSQTPLPRLGDASCECKAWKERAPLSPSERKTTPQHHSRPYGDERRHECCPIAIHPGSGGAFKCWPVPSFIAVIEMLLQRSLPVLLLGGPADHVRIQEIEHHVLSGLATKRNGLFTTLIDAPLLAVAAQLQRCRGYLGNDSGITHLAALLGIPTLALFGPSDPAIWHPIGPHVSVLYEPDLQHLSSDTVMHALAAFILS